MKRLFKPKFSQIVGALSLVCASVLLLGGLFLLGRGEKPIINITDHSGDKADLTTPPGSIFVDLDKESTLTDEEIASIVASSTENSVVNVSEQSKLPSEFKDIPGAGKLSVSGYHTSDLKYEAGNFILAKWTTGFDLPDSFSLRKRTEQTLKYVQKSDYSQFTPEYTDIEADRPALELYMGFLFVDNGNTLDVYSTKGRHLTAFSDTNYIPAYTRDSYGNPLFYRMTTVESGRFDGETVIRDKEAETVERDREPHEKEETVIIKGKLENEGKGNPVTEEVKAYYSLSDAGYFTPSQYKDSLESRGLYFNYPSYYGIPDSNISLFGETYDKYHLNIDGELKMDHKIDWSYKRYGNALNEEKFEQAYNFRGGLACVYKEGYYQDGGMYFINASGNRAFNTLRKYNNENSDRYVIENYMPPITRGPESIGYFYYENGLVRARFETIDYWNYDKNNRIQVYSSEEVLINTKGERFPLPVGYNLKAYSDGMILLEKDGLYGFMDYTGAWIAEPIYSYAEAFCEGLAVLKTRDGRFGMIDTAGNIVLPFAYSHISSCSDGLVVCYSDTNGWEVMRKMTK